MKRLLVPIALVAGALLLQGHEFWIAPSQFILEEGDKVVLELKVGEGYLGEHRDLKKARLARFEWSAPGEQRVVFELENFPDSSHFVIDSTAVAPGTSLVYYQSKNSYIELGAEDFAAYLQEDGLGHMDSLRRAQGIADKPAREQYARYCKTMLQCGANAVADSSAYGALYPDTYEIVPLDNPYAHRAGDKLGFRLIFKGKPLAGAKVVFWHRAGEKLTKAEAMTDAGGRVLYNFPLAGPWLVSSVWMEELADKTTADYQSHWASLTFEMRK